MKEILKAIAFLILGSQLKVSYRIKRIKKNNYLTILNLHRVCPDDDSAYTPLDPYIFEELIIFLKGKFLITTFSELSFYTHSDVIGKPLLVISFDDGYKDFIEIAAPILDKYEVIVNHNLIPECVESGCPPLNVAVQDFVGKAHEKDLRLLSIPGFSMGPELENRVNLGFRISQFIKNKPMIEQCQIKTLIISQVGELLQSYSTAMMSMDDVKKISKVHELGAHSYSHANMEYETDDFVKDDLVACRQWFNENLNQQVKIYAFPNGSYKPVHIEFAREAGYETILLVNDGFSSVGLDTHNRFGFDARSKSEMRFKATGRLR